MRLTPCMCPLLAPLHHLGSSAALYVCGLSSHPWAFAPENLSAWSALLSGPQVAQPTSQRVAQGASPQHHVCLPRFCSDQLWLHCCRALHSKDPGSSGCSQCTSWQGASVHRCVSLILFCLSPALSPGSSVGPRAPRCRSAPRHHQLWGDVVSLDEITWERF